MLGRKSGWTSRGLQLRIARAGDLSDLVSHVEDVLELLAHAVVLGGEEGRVQHDEQRHARVEQLNRTDHRQSSWVIFVLDLN